MNKRMDIRRITYDALLAAMCAVLGYFSLSIGTSWKFTFENIPVLIGALMFGPLDGALIGGIGTLIYQMVRFGLEISTPLWILPYVVSGLMVGFAAKKKRFRFKPWEIVLLMIVNGLVVTAVNTGSLYIYYKYILQIPLATMLANIPIRIAVSIVKAVVCAVLIPLLIQGLEKAGIYTRPGRKTGKTA
ncbi:MAG: folate family ECF transporter S component [Lachnospiraceae bacterium]|nr:folate family ECF transporter S component [Lachnospiraceae bacterium]